MGTKITLEVEKCTVIVGDGTDLIHMTIKAPPTVFPFGSGVCYLSINAVHGTGLKWIEDNFPELTHITEAIWNPIKTRKSNK